MQITRPEASLFVVGTAYGAEVCGERVKPDVKDVWLFARNGNAPAKCGARDAQVFQATFDETDDLVLARFRLNEIWILFVKIEQRFLERRKLEEIIFFGDGFERAATVGTVVSRLRIIHKSVVVNAVLTSVLALVNVTVFLEQLEKPLQGAAVTQIGGADEFIGGDA